jgi:hypothetical protein
MRRRNALTGKVLRPFFSGRRGGERLKNRRVAFFGSASGCRYM